MDASNSRLMKLRSYIQAHLLVKHIAIFIQKLKQLFIYFEWNSYTVLL